MLKLPNITLFAIDCVTPARTLLAMRYSCRWVKFGRIILLTDLTKGRVLEPRVDGIEIHHLEQSDEKRAPFPGHPPICLAYDRDILTKTVDYCDTPYLLHLEHDSAVMNPMAWQPAWTTFDFIGAPWPPHIEPGWPACDETNNVGNFGFCLGSREFWHMCKRAVGELGKDPAMAKQAISSDRFICRTARPWMEKVGKIQFAPWDVAWRFSCENRIYADEFGYHGKATAALNGWGGKMFEDVAGNNRPVI